MVYLLAQGFAQAIYDLGGNYIILNLWSGINTSPINAMHAGYGIGAIVAIQISKNFIVFNQYDLLLAKSNLTTAMTGKNDSLKSTGDSQQAPLHWEKIALKLPYWFAGLFALFITFLFIIAQIYEQKVRKEFEKNRKQLVLLTDNQELNINNNSNNNNDRNSIASVQSKSRSKLNTFVQRLLFGNKCHEKSTLVYLLTQLILIILVFVFNQGYFTVITRFMFTYLIVGPARLNMEVFVIIQTLFWSFFIFGRFFAAYVVFKVDSMKFYLVILVANLAFSSLFLFPYLTNFRMFFWICISLLGATSGPMTPTGFVVAKRILEVNSFLLSLLIVGLAIGGIIFQQITGGFLDLFRPDQNWMGFTDANYSYIIPYFAFAGSLLCLLAFVPVYLLYVKYHQKLNSFIIQ
jgi:hypothetical protein